MRELLIVSALGFGLTILSACAPRTQQIEVSTAPVERPALILPVADSVNMRPVEWTIITPDNVETVLAELESSGRPAALFALTSNGYEALSLNLNDIRTHIQQLNSIIVAYDRYYVN